MRWPLLSLLSIIALSCRKDDDTAIVDTDTSVAPTDADNDGYAAEVDCDDANASIHPDAVEVCNGADDDCDDATDDDALDAEGFYADADDDGHGDPDAVQAACDAPAGYTDVSDDCDDDDPDAFPGGKETCDGVDNNCDGDIDEDATDTKDFYADVDGDGYGQTAISVAGCEAPAGYAAADGDCDDADVSVHPDAAEASCTDPVDYNCDGAVGYADGDDDGFAACKDCDDADRLVNSAAIEVCNGDDDDCDLTVDEDSAVGAPVWYADTDGDGFGDATATKAACAQPTGFVATATDCDDTSGTTHPGAAETCNSVDDNCNSATDEAATDAPTWYGDADGDGHGGTAFTQKACAQPAGFESTSDDCDDLDASSHPGAAEVCDQADNDCNVLVDDGASGGTNWYVDADNDTYGDPNNTTVACAQPANAVADKTDCDDAASAVHPLAPELCDSIDNDCDAVADDRTIVSVGDGSLNANTDLRFQYSPVTAGAGFIRANWTADPDADSYEVSLGTTPGGTNVVNWTSAGTTPNHAFTALTVTGAWQGATTYYVNVRVRAGTTTCAVQTSNGVRIAEAATWDGTSAGVRNAADAGFSVDFPTSSGFTTFFGAHYFETVNIASGTTVRVQPFGKVDAVPAGILVTDARVTAPKDGWLAVSANAITVSGTIDAVGRGYGGGAGGSSASVTADMALGGSNGLSGRGGGVTTFWGLGSGGGGGGAGRNPQLGVPQQNGGNGGARGGGGGGSGCRDCVAAFANNGLPGAADASGGAGGGPGGGAGGAAATYQGGRGANGAPQPYAGGGGGGGYGAGGGGGGWDGHGGGGGGTGGSDGGVYNGGNGLGTGRGAGAPGGGALGRGGAAGGYLAVGANGDSSTDRTVLPGSGGGGGDGGSSNGEGGGGGGAGGGAITLRAAGALTLNTTAVIVASGAAGGGGSANNGSDCGGGGGGGGGGGIVLEGQTVTSASGASVRTRGGQLGADSSGQLGGNGGNGDAQAVNGGTIKLFYGTFTGTKPTAAVAGRVYDAGNGSFTTP